ncbi:Uncharacterised protein [uncultured archaeon]|nr:Uncharacterised protein [uncultured archaeon]
MEPSMFWIIVLISGISVATLICFVFFGSLLNRKFREELNIINLVYKWLIDAPPRSFDPSFLSNMMDEFLNRRNEFWMLYGQFILSLFVIVCVTILLLTGVISAEAGLPILSGIGGFAIGKGISGGRTSTYGKGIEEKR